MIIATISNELGIEHAVMEADRYARMMGKRVYVHLQKSGRQWGYGDRFVVSTDRYTDGEMVYSTALPVQEPSELAQIIDQVRPGSLPLKPTRDEKDREYEKGEPKPRGTCPPSWHLQQEKGQKLNAPCQTCGRLGGDVLTALGEGYTMGVWCCPWCVSERRMATPPCVLEMPSIAGRNGFLCVGRDGSLLLADYFEGQWQVEAVILSWPVAGRHSWECRTGEILPPTPERKR